MIITTGTITAVDGATLPATYTDSTGSNIVALISGLSAGSRIQIYNSTDLAEIKNEVVAGTSFQYTYIEGGDFTSGDSIRIRATKKGFLPFETFAVAGVNGWSVLANQQVDAIYNQFNTDGATISEFTWDGINLEVDITDANNETIIQRIAAWSAYFVTTEVGIRDFFGAITWEFYNLVRINSAIADIKLDNKKAEALLLEGGKLYRTDGQSIISDDTTGPIHVVGGVGSAQGDGVASIVIDYDAGLTVTAMVFTLAGVQQGATVNLTDNGSGLYTGTFLLTGVADGQYIVRFLNGSIKIGSGSLFVRGEDEVSQEYFFNPNFDIVQSVSATTTNLDMVAAPDNASIALVLADTNELQTNQGNWLTATGFATPTNVSDAQTAIIAEVNANEAKIDLLETKTQADARQVLIAKEATLAGLNNLSAAQVRTELSIELGRIDTTISSRNATAPDNASITAILADTAELQANQGQWLTATGFATPANVSAVETKVDALETKAQADARQVLIAKEATVAALNNLSAAQVAAELATYDVPTKAELDSAIAGIPSAPTTGAIRTELATELARIDVAISTRLATAGYTAPPSAATNATAVRSELSTELGRIDVATSTRSTPANVTDAVTSIKGADNKDLTQVFDNSPTIDLTTVTDAIAALNDLSLAEIESSTVLAKEATVATKLNASAYTAPDNAGIVGIKAKTDLFSFTGNDVNATLDGEQVVASNMVSLSGIATTANVNNAVTNLKGASDKDLTQVFNNTPTIDLSPVTGAIAALNDFNPATDTVARVTLVDTCTTNTDMRGTNGAITSLSGIATSANVTSAQSAIIAEVNANEVKIDATLAQATLARKHVANRDKINTTANTLTRYDDDGVTPIRIFNLKDDAGNASSASIFEKVPQ
jgi:hypothetical protein